jgi:hypothetical protein
LLAAFGMNKAVNSAQCDRPEIAASGRGPKAPAPTCSGDIQDVSPRPSRATQPSKAAADTLFGAWIVQFGPEH